MIGNRLKHLVGRSLERSIGPLVPGSRRLAFEHAKSRLLGFQEVEIGALERLAARRDVALDVGANNGAHTYAMSKIFEKVYAFEPNRQISKPIRDANLANVNVNVNDIDMALSSTSGDAVLHIPVKNGQVLAGWASLGAVQLDSDRIQDLSIRTATLDSFAISGVSFIKIDVEGHEMEVFEGARQTLARDKPVCLVETPASDAPRLLEFLSGLGLAYTFHRNWRGVEMSPHNVLLQPL